MAANHQTMTGHRSPSENDTDYYNRFTDGYSPYAAGDLETMFKPLDKIIHRFEKPKICEVGSASGQFSRHLAQRYGEDRVTLYGLDIAARVLALYPYHRICGSAFNLPIRNESMDIVCLPAALHHLFPLEDSIVELNRILKRKGYLYCLEPNLHHPQRFFFMRFKALYNLYRKTNDVPINADKLTVHLRKQKLAVVAFDYVNLHFAKPSILQKIQNMIASTICTEALKKYTYPWFILIAEKG